ncbi:SpoIIE family protein phosphatase [Candidatus Peregrinibacteria bacterium]|nr:SpoIIE family protein phosphatase [Candidatus Peregrinibacteria bacterium]
MKFIRQSIIGKALFLFAVLMAIAFGLGIALNRGGVDAIPTNFFLLAVVSGLALIFILFAADIVAPLKRLTRQVQNLLTGKSYRRIDPTTIDEVGVLTHFFNEITRDLEKISYDLRERRRMSSELDIASQIQQDVLPKEAPATPGLDIVAKTRAAAEIGGDTFDFLLSPDGSQLFIYVGDVTGHGVPSGLIMMMVDTLVTTLVAQGVANGRDIIVKTNALLTPRISSRLFMTTVMLRWVKSEQKFYYTGAGHEHILVYRKATETVEPIKSGGIALGMIPDVSKIAMEKEIPPLAVGDCVVLYSDGITEAKNQTGEMHGLQRLADSLKKHGYRPTAEGIFDSLTKEFQGFVEEYVQIDDITMIVIKYLGPDAAPSKVKLAVSSEEASAEHKSKVWDWTS